MIGNESTPDLDTGLANWYLDYPHPNDYFAPQLSSAGITPTASTNYAHFHDPASTARSRSSTASRSARPPKRPTPASTAR